MKNKVKILLTALTGCFLAGCTCYNTHVPGRHIDHGENPGGIDRFFCNLDYILFPPEQGYVVAPAPAVAVPPPAPVVVQPVAVAVPEYNYGWWKGVWVPRYQDWYWYHGTWVWGGRGMRPVPPAWAPNPKRPVPPPVVVAPKPHHHGRPAPVHRPAPIQKSAPVQKPASAYKQSPSRQSAPTVRKSNRGTQVPRPSADNPRPVKSR